MSLSSLLLAAITLAAPFSDDPEGLDGSLGQPLPLYIGDDGGMEEVMEDACDEIERLRSSPLNINKVESDDLLQLPGVDLNTASAILLYRHRYGAFRSVQELDMIAEIDDRMRRYLEGVLYVDGSDTLDWYSAQRLRYDIAHPRQMVLMTAAVPTYYRAGDRGATTAGAAGVNKYADTYLGDPVRHSLRYTMSVGNNLQLSLTGSKTAGEPFGRAGNNLGYDYYSYSLSMQDLGRFRRIILGQFRGQFGMGLVLNNNLAFGKQAMLASVGKLANAFRPHSGTSDSRHLQGAAMTLDLGSVELSAFLSWRHIDATLNDDGTVSTILTDGYHRTANEMAKKNNTAQTAAGAHLKYGRNTWSGLDWAVGMSFLYTGFDRGLNPVYSKSGTVSAARMYRLHYPTGSEFWNASVDYKADYRRLHLAGETAMCDNGALATVNHILWNAARRLTLSAQQRYYSYRYHSLYGSGLGDGRTVQNESAVLLGARWSVNRRLVIDAYSDIAYYPWLRYRVSDSSHAWDNNVLATLTGRRWTFSLRYRQRKTQQDETAADGSGAKSLADHTTQRLRLTALLDGRRWTARSHCEGILTESHSKGFILSQSAGCRLGRGWMAYAAAAYFDTDDYDTRLYAYERGMLYSFSNMSYYGNGMRGALLLRADLAGWVMVQAKVGYTKYFDRSVIGTAERQIFSSHQTDIEFQLRFKL